MSFLSQHKLIVIIAIIVVAGGVWYGLSGSSASAPPLLTQTSTSGNSADQDLVSTLLALRSVKLDGTILSDPSFLQLKDFSTQIVPEPVGRPNPFAPLTAGASTSPNSTHAAQLFNTK